MFFILHPFLRELLTFTGRHSALRKAPRGIAAGQATEASPIAKGAESCPPPARAGIPSRITLSKSSRSIGRTLQTRDGADHDDVPEDGIAETDRLLQSQRENAPPPPAPTVARIVSADGYSSSPVITPTG